MATTPTPRTQPATAGDWSHAATTDYQSHATTIGDWSHATTAGDRSHAATTGDRSYATTTGVWSHAATTGNGSHAATTGYGSRIATTGSRTVAIAVGDGSSGSCGPDGALILRWTDPAGRPRITVGYAGETISANTVYHLNDHGEFVEVVELLADDGRGYTLTYQAGRYVAGCRDFTAHEAITHWSNPDHPAPESAARLLAAVIEHEGANR